MQDGDEEERDGRSHPVGRNGGDRAGEPAEAVLNQPGERRLADPAETQRSERYPQLSRGDVPVERLYRAARQPSFAISRLRHLVQASLPGPHQGKLGRHEEGVRQDQNHDGHEAQENRRRFWRFHTVKV